MSLRNILLAVSYVFVLKFAAFHQFLVRKGSVDHLLICLIWHRISISCFRKFKSNKRDYYSDLFKIKATVISIINKMPKQDMKKALEILITAELQKELISRK